ncbi:antirepressor regulating drug resistance protein [Desulfosporosinus acidiphilus SJ4]|uniref:Antirepressor regulating drug resistance protein n=1 Tax=Desulfosporosinus acidiphilus (strain DSM 22704 / JCM 16185 / SJ4) TaxID=646529 RepID=I4D793_DESAJ|nr:antirepressor regulating drug resistance protein [Desulfosporosinus acidiphilus SJ4]
MLTQRLVNYLSLFDWVLTISAKASIFMIFLLGFKYILRFKIGARFQYLLWSSLLLSLLLPWTPTSPVSVYNILHSSELQQSMADAFNHPYMPYSAMVKSLQANLDKNPIEMSKDSKTIIPPTNRLLSSDIPIVIQLTYIIWSSGVLILSLFTVITNKRFSATIENHSISDQRLLTNFHKLKLDLKIKAEIPLITTRYVNSPSLFGLLHPRILLPLGFEQTFDSEQMNYILLHELLHYKRKDLWVNLLAQLLVVIHWFNPLIWYAFLRMKEDQETACDASVLSRLAPEQSYDYANTLIRLAETYSASPRMASIASLGGSKSQIKRRLLLIAKPKHTSVKWILLSAAIIGVIAVATLTGPVMNAEPIVAESNEARNSYVLPESNDLSSGIKIEDITGPTYKGKVMLIKDPKRVQLAITKNIGVKGERISDLVKDKGAIAGINAGGFADPNGQGTGAFPEGLIMHDGKIVYNDVGDKAVNIVGFDEQGKLVAGNMTAKKLLKSNLREVATFSPNLIVNGKAVISGDGGWGIAPRTGIGQRADGTVIFVVIDGRQPTWSLGATLRDLTKVFADYQAVNAVNLDGGSSSEMVYQGKVQNRLSSLYGERYLPTAFIVS